MGSRGHLVRPFLAAEILGGFTAFSACAVDGKQLTTTGHLLLGVATCSALVACLAAVFLTTRVTRRIADPQESRLWRRPYCLSLSGPPSARRCATWLTGAYKAHYSTAFPCGTLVVNVFADPAFICVNADLSRPQPTTPRR